ncbi:MAG: preprotein translocase subunit SecA [Schleiferiaceae bacterium]|nr:preprotein translocase subunit SecA [Schleiferiaceae bacterium]MDO7719029.1 preprotein translocase subunit SecA [Schleiferiaceae bacterium]
MIQNLLKKLLGDKSERDIKEIKPFIEKIHAAEAAIKGITAQGLRDKTADFKLRLKEGGKPEQEIIDDLKQQIESTENFAEKDDLYKQLEQAEKDLLDKEESILTDILPEAFAVIRETAKQWSNGDLVVQATVLDRSLAATLDAVSISDDATQTATWHQTWSAAGIDVTWNMVHYDVQLIGGVVLHQGRIAEMATGEGKTLVATLPVYLNALSGRGVHVVTVNNYLAKRDAEWMGPMYQFHGLEVDCIDKHQPNSEERRMAYRKDVIFGTNNEFGFDYLRDNMAKEMGDLVQQKHHFAIVDEVDSVLIDDARTPLIISGPTPNGDVQEYTHLKSHVVDLLNHQKAVAQESLRQAKILIEAGDNEQGGVELLRSFRALPKNKALIKFLSTEGTKQLLQKTEGVYMAEQGKQMKKIDVDLFFTIEEKTNQINLTDKGIELLSERTSADFFLMPDMSTDLNVIEQSNVDLASKAQQKDALLKDYRLKSERVHAMSQLLKAYALFEKDVEYVVMDSKVKIVDEQTGRIMDGRRYSDGLHQALEAKEDVTIEAATQTYATITLQNYFRMYNKLSGMTGTAETEAGEFYEIYKLDVTVIPTNRPIVRDDRQDLVYKTNREKYNAAIDEVITLRDSGRPVLVGTTSVEISELFARALNMRKVPHQVLNAKLHQKEADIVAEAGRPGTVTIATNMAGRGTDIKLTDEAKAAGGLAIVGTERHDSRRVDRQLRGRAGRQGDPGSSQFFVSLEDKLMRLFGSERIAKMMDRMGHQEGEVIQHKMVSNSIERAQKKVEENNFGMRKRLLDYDDVMNSQRTGIYKKRKNALSGERLSLDIANMALENAYMIANKASSYSSSSAQDAANGNPAYASYKLSCFQTYGMETPVSEKLFEQYKTTELSDATFDAAMSHYQAKNQRVATQALPVLHNVKKEQGDQITKILVPFTDGSKGLQVASNLDQAIETEGQTLIQDMEKGVVLSMIDDNWKEHLRNMDDLRQNVQGAVYEQKDPLLIYKHESYDLFMGMLDEMNQSIVSFLFNAGLPIENQDPQRAAQSMQRAPQRSMKQEYTTSGPGNDEGSQDDQNNPQSGQGSRRSRRNSPVQRQHQVPQQANPASRQASSSKKYGRNDKVTITNIATGESKQVKFKVAEPMLGKGWTLL